MCEFSYIGPKQLDLIKQTFNNLYQNLQLHFVNIIILAMGPIFQKIFF